MEDIQYMCQHVHPPNQVRPSYGIHMPCLFACFLQKVRETEMPLHGVAAAGNNVRAPLLF